MENEIDKFELGKLYEKVDFQGKLIEELKDSCKELSNDIVKKSEELKDCFTISDSIKTKVEEFILAENLKYEDIKDRLNKLEDNYGSFAEVKSKITINWIQALITITALLFGISVKMGVL